MCPPDPSPAPLRLFLVGCSRSGTTVVQRSLAAHSDIISFPETDFLCNCFGKRAPHLRMRFGRTTPERQARAFERLAKALNIPELSFGDDALSDAPTALSRFISTLDSVAAERGARAWLEKTPKHFRFAGELERELKDVRIIHLIRDGREVVASLVDRARTYPGFSKERDPRVAARLWNEAVRVAFRHRNRSNHLLLSFEHFVQNPERALRRVCTHIGFDYQSGMCSSTSAHAIVSPTETWKAGAHLPLRAPMQKFEKIFSPAEQRNVSKMLDWRRYHRLFSN